MNKRNCLDIIQVDMNELLKNWGVDEILYLGNLRDRKLFIPDVIDESIIYSVVRHILRYNAEDKNVPVKERKPIFLYCSSVGGDVDSGFELIDVIQQSKTPVYTINLGWCYSMGFLIFLAGDRRFASKSSKFLMHDGSEVIINSGTKAQDQFEFSKKMSDKIKQYVLSNSKLTEEEYDAQQRREWYLFADEAKEKGFCDYIIGEDCTLDEIV